MRGKTTGAQFACAVPLRVDIADRCFNTMSREILFEQLVHRFSLYRDKGPLAQLGLRLLYPFIEDAALVPPCGSQKLQ